MTFLGGTAAGEIGRCVTLGSRRDGLASGLTVEGDFAPGFVGPLAAEETVKLAGRLPVFDSTLCFAGVSRVSFRGDLGAADVWLLSAGVALGAGSIFDSGAVFRGETTGAMAGTGRVGFSLLVLRLMVGVEGNAVDSTARLLMGSSTAVTDSGFSGTLVATVSAPSVVSLLKRRLETLDSPL